MKILNISPYKGTTWLLETDSGEKIYIGQKTAERYNLKAGLDLPEAALDEIKESDLERKSRERAMYLLTGKDYGFAELFRKLEKSYPPRMALDTCRAMAEMGLIDDRKYARKLANQLFEIKLESERSVRFKLSQKEIPKDIIEETVEEFCGDELVEERLCRLIKKKYQKNLSDKEGVRKVRDALARRGFGYDDIKRALKSFEEEAEQFTVDN